MNEWLSKTDNLSNFNEKLEIDKINNMIENKLSLGKQYSIKYNYLVLIN